MADWKGGMDATTIFAGVILGSIGMGYIVYGKKRQNLTALFSGILLCVVPYFISNIYLLVIAGAALTVFPVLKRG